MQHSLNAILGWLYRTGKLDDTLSDTLPRDVTLSTILPLAHYRPKPLKHGEALLLSISLRDPVTKTHHKIVIHIMDDKLLLGIPGLQTRTFDGYDTVVDLEVCGGEAVLRSWPKSTDQDAKRTSLGWMKKRKRQSR